MGMLSYQEESHLATFSIRLSGNAYPEQVYRDSVSFQQHSALSKTKGKDMRKVQSYDV